MSKVEQRLKELGIELPNAPTPRASYVPAKQTGNLVYTSGQSCVLNDEILFVGKVGRELTKEQGYEAARLTMVNCLAALKWAIGDLDRIKQIVKVLGFVNSADGFVEQPYVINGGSDLLEQVFGDNGKHARSAIGTSILPFNIPVEIEMIVELYGFAGTEPTEERLR